jgi:hypothetical protein
VDYVGRVAAQAGLAHTHLAVPAGSYHRGRQQRGRGLAGMAVVNRFGRCRQAAPNMKFRRRRRAVPPLVEPFSWGGVGVDLDVRSRHVAVDIRASLAYNPVELFL